MIDRISIDPKICHGQACIKGTRILVHLILHMLANGDTVDELLEEYPSALSSLFHPYSPLLDGRLVCCIISCLYLVSVGTSRHKDPILILAIPLQ